MGGNSGHEYTQYKNKLFHPPTFYTTLTMSDAKIKELETRIKILEHLVSTLTVQTTKKVKVKKAKDPDAPKRAPNAYNFFVREMKKLEPKTDMKELGRMWREDFSEEDDRTTWTEMAAEAKNTYQEEMKEYKKATE